MNHMSIRDVVVQVIDNPSVSKIERVNDVAVGPVLRHQREMHTHWDN